MFRSKKLTDAARHAPCMRCNRHLDTVTACHSNWQEHGKGRGLKAHDIFTAFLCIDCNRLIDDPNVSDWDPEMRKAEWMRAHIQTLLYLLDMKILVVR